MLRKKKKGLKKIMLNWEIIFFSYDFRGHPVYLLLFQAATGWLKINERKLYYTEKPPIIMMMIIP